MKNTSEFRITAKWWILLLLLSTMLVFYFTVPAFQGWLGEVWKVVSTGDEESVSAWIRQYSVWGPLVIIVAMTLQLFLFVIPSVLLITVAVITYGSLWGGLLSLVAVLTASMVGYTLGAMLSRSKVSRLIGNKTLERTQVYVSRYGFWTVVVVRLSPFLSNDAISIVSGVLRMSAIRFFFATALGTTPLISAIAYLGVHTSSLNEKLTWIAGLSLIALLVLIGFDQMRSVRRN